MLRPVSACHSRSLHTQVGTTTISNRMIFFLSLLMFGRENQLRRAVPCRTVWWIRGQLYASTFGPFPVSLQHSQAFERTDENHFYAERVSAHIATGVALRLTSSHTAPWPSTKHTIDRQIIPRKYVCREKLVSHLRYRLHTLAAEPGVLASQSRELNIQQRCNTLRAVCSSSIPA